MSSIFTKFLCLAYAFHTSGRLTRISHQIADADASGFEPQRGVLTKPTPTAWVCGRRCDGALKGRATVDATDCGSPLQGSTFRVKAHL